MKTFNAFQMVCLFVAWPWLVNWLHQASFSGAAVAFWTAIVVYVIGFVAMVGSVRVAIDEL